MFESLEALCFLILWLPNVLLVGGRLLLPPAEVPFLVVFKVKAEVFSCA